MGSAAILGGYQVASRATRDTLFLSNFNVSSLPLMVAVSSAVSILVALAAARAMATHGPARVVPVAFLGGALLTLGEWVLVLRRPDLGAIALYIHVAALSPVLISGFWSMLNEHLDPRSAKKAVGRIGAVGTLGGVAGSLVVERLTTWTGVAAALPVLAIAQAWCFWSTRRLPRPIERPATAAEAALPLPAKEAYRRLLSTPYLRNLALIVLVSSTSAALLEYVFRVQVVDVARHSLALMRVFSAFYAAVAVLTFVLQAVLSRPALERAGLGPTIGTLPAAVIVGGTAAAFVPGPWSLSVVRGLESVLRGSLFRAGYEILYTPIPPAEKRATKTLVDVGCDRLGEILGAGIVALVLVLAASGAVRALLAIAVVLAAVTLAVVTQLQRGYVSSLEAGLKAGAVHLDPLQVMDATTRVVLLRPATQLDAAHVPQAIELLARDETAGEAVEALRLVAPRHVGQLVDALLDPGSYFAVRRRIPRVLAVCTTARAVEGLTGGLADNRFEVRYQCGRALARILERDPSLGVNPERMYATVCQEAALGRKVWDSHRLLDRLEGRGEERSEDRLVDEFLRERAGRSLEHVFTLLALVLPREPLRIAFRGLYADDPMLRGTVLEYLESVLPPHVRAALWPYLEPDRASRRAAPAAPRDREQVLNELLQSNRSIELNLEDLRRRQGLESPAPGPTPEPQ